EDLVVHRGQLIAAATVEGNDWHGRLFASPDGESWSQVAEVRGPSGFLSIDALLTDGTTLAVLAAEHPCSGPFDGNPGWVLGARWANHQRMFLGADASTLTQPGHADVALVPDPIAYDCNITDGYALSSEHYPSFTGAVVGERITLLDTTPPLVDEWEDDEPPVEHTRRTVAQLVDGAWIVETSEDLP